MVFPEASVKSSAAGNPAYPPCRKFYRKRAGSRAKYCMSSFVGRFYIESVASAGSIHERRERMAAVKKCQGTRSQPVNVFHRAMDGKLRVVKRVRASGRHLEADGVFLLGAVHLACLTEGRSASCARYARYPCNTRKSGGSESASEAPQRRRVETCR